MSSIPYKIYLEENEMPDKWYNVRADMKKKPAPILNPGTLKPVTLEELSGIFCTELAKQELVKKLQQEYEDNNKVKVGVEKVLQMDTTGRSAVLEEFRSKVLLLWHMTPRINDTAL